MGAGSSGPSRGTPVRFIILARALSPSHDHTERDVSWGRVRSARPEVPG